MKETKRYDGKAVFPYTINGAAPITLYLLNEDFSVCKVSDYS